DMFHVLLGRRPDVNARSTKGWTALHAAVSQQNLGMVQELLRRGAAPTAPTDDRVTPLALAGSGESREIVDELRRRLPSAYVFSERDVEQLRKHFYVAPQFHDDAKMLFINAFLTTVQDAPAVGREPAELPGRLRAYLASVYEGTEAKVRQALPGANLTAETLS